MYKILVNFARTQSCKCKLSKLLGMICGSPALFQLSNLHLKSAFTPFTPGCDRVSLKRPAGTTRSRDGASAARHRKNDSGWDGGGGSWRLARVSGGLPRSRKANTGRATKAELEPLLDELGCLAEQIRKVLETHDASYANCLIGSRAPWPSSRFGDDFRVVRLHLGQADKSGDQRSPHVSKTSD